MSPEQLQGRRVDHSSDIFSLGVLMYEMVTAQRPFRGKTPLELVSSIPHDPPTAVAELRAELPADLQKILDRCLHPCVKCAMTWTGTSKVERYSSGAGRDFHELWNVSIWPVLAPLGLAFAFHSQGQYEEALAVTQAGLRHCK
jgi:serine/threonine protein kinase